MYLRSEKEGLETAGVTMYGWKCGEDPRRRTADSGAGVDGGVGDGEGGRSYVVNYNILRKRRFYPRIFTRILQTGQPFYFSGKLKKNNVEGLIKEINKSLECSSVYPKK